MVGAGSMVANFFRACDTVIPRRPHLESRASPYFAAASKTVSIGTESFCCALRGGS